MIFLINGFCQAPNGAPNVKGAITFQLNLDASILATPYGQVPASQILVFQLDANGNLVQPAQIYSNLELNPQNASGLGTYYYVTIYDANGARMNEAPMVWQFVEAANSTVDISQMTPYLYPLV
jgi:hypothetical protein